MSKIPQEAIDSVLTTPPAPQPTDEACPCCGGSGHYGDAAVRAINGAIPPTEREQVLEEALCGLLKHWSEFENTSGNMEEAYYKLAKYAFPEWVLARAVLAGKAPSQTDRAEY